MRRWLGPGVLLLAAYLNLSLAMSPRGFLGTDTGGKVATLRAMDGCNCLDPDVGYWAERWDPDGSLHPLHYTSRVGSRWVDATTLPMLLAAWPLYEVGGYRAALLLPMAGAVAAALAAAALARRIALDAGPRAFLVAGLASPLVVYALDFWEHTIGVAFVGWAVVLLYDLVDGRATRFRPALIAALLLGIAATMRTEAIVYAAVAAAVVAGVLLSRGTATVRRIALVGAAALPFLLAPLVVNDVLERAVLGSSFRATRTAGTASVAGDEPASRGVEASYTTIAAEGAGRGVVLGAAIVLLLVVAWRRGRVDARRAPARSEQRFALVTLGGAAALFVVRIADGGLGFVPGMAIAWPLAIGALAVSAKGSPLARAMRRRATVPVAVALGAVPLVLLTQYRGGAAPQWGGRYLLTSGLLLTAVAVAQLRVLAKPVAAAMVAGAVAVTAFGVAWLGVRSHDVERAISAINDRSEPVVVSTVGHLAREGGAFHGDKRWLTAVGDAELREAAGVVAAAGEDRLVLVDHAVGVPPAVPGYRLVGRTTTLRLFAGVDLRLTTWRR